MNAQQSGSTRYAAYLLFVVSILGVLDIFTSGSLMGKHTPLMAVDIIVYAVLFVVAIFIHQQVNIAKVLYIILAGIWYIALIFFLPAKFDHTLNLYLVFIQIVITILALCLAYPFSSKKDE